MNSGSTNFQGFWQPKTSIRTGYHQSIHLKLRYKFSNKTEYPDQFTRVHFRHTQHLEQDYSNFKGELNWKACYGILQTHADVCDKCYISLWPRKQIMQETARNTAFCSWNFVLGLSSNLLYFSRAVRLGGKQHDMSNSHQSCIVNQNISTLSCKHWLELDDTGQLISRQTHIAPNVFGQFT